MSIEERCKIILLKSLEDKKEKKQMFKEQELELINDFAIKINPVTVEIYQNEFAPADAIFFLINGKKLLIEVKCREKTYDHFLQTYKNEGLMIEKYKYDSIISEAIKLNAEPTYLCSFGCGTITVCNLSDIMVTQGIKNCPSDEYHSIRKNKECYFIPFEQLSKV